ncbi:aminopeptidase YwaD [Bacillus fengqiuensis]|nr:aminopeptidase YwaD [Bacillus fengqiuensis]
MYRKAMSKTMTALLAAALTMSAGTVSAETSPSAQTNPSSHAFDNKIIKRINADNMYNTIALLSQQPREAGTEGEWQAVQYIKSQFEKYGYETELQPFPIYDAKEGATGTASAGGKDLDVHVFSGSFNGDVTSELVYVKKAYPEEVPDSVKGKIALVERGDLSFIEKMENVIDKGAVGVIMFNREGASGNDFGVVDPGQNIPAVAISREQGLELVDQLKSGPVGASIHVEGSGFIEKTSYNVIASKKPNPNKDTGQIVSIGAHHDSVHGGPGANDDASGVSAVLELARVMADTPTDTELRFVTFGAEEKGLLGSYHYASELTKEEVKNHVAHFQMDMIGSRNAGGDYPAGGLIMFTIDGKPNLVTNLGNSAGARTASENIPYGHLGRSDHEPFQLLGIPSALFIHAPLEPEYHTPQDTIEHIDKDKLKQAADIVGAAAYQIARPDTPALENARVAPPNPDTITPPSDPDRPVD